MGKGILLICVCYVLQQEDAEELVSNTFLKAFRALGSFEYRDEGSLKAWSSQIAVNECLMFLRKKNNLIFSTDQMEQFEHIQSEDTDIIHTLSAKALFELIHQLPGGYRTI